MKQILFILFLFPCILSFSQSNSDTPLTTTTYKTCGYIDGKRLDSIDAQYAEFSWRGHSWLFDYGQIHDAWKDLRFTDNKGVALNFYDGDETSAFNFFYFNGLQLDHVADTFYLYFYIEKAC